MTDANLVIDIHKGKEELTSGNIEEFAQVVVGSYHAVDLAFSIWSYHPDLSTAPEETKALWSTIKDKILCSLAESSSRVTNVEAMLLEVL